MWLRDDEPLEGRERNSGTARSIEWFVSSFVSGLIYSVNTAANHTAKTTRGGGRASFTRERTSNLSVKPSRQRVFFCGWSTPRLAYRWLDGKEMGIEGIEVAALKHTLPFRLTPATGERCCYVLSHPPHWVVPNRVSSDGVLAITAKLKGSEVKTVFPLPSQYHSTMCHSGC